MKYKFSSIVILMIAILITACNPQAQLTEISSDTITYPETIPINNCGNKSPSTQSSSRSFSTRIAATGSIKASYAKIIEGSVSANYEQYRNTTKTHTVTAAPDTNMEFVLIWSDDVRTGNVTVNGKSVNYTVNIPISVEQKSSRDLGCNGQPPLSGLSDAEGITVTILDVASGNRYSYFTGKLIVGATVYSDRDYLYSKIPSFLDGKTYIATSNADLFSTDTNFLTFSIDRDATIYVAYDDRYTSKPSWLNNFQDTGADIEYSWSGGAIKLSLFGKQFSKGQVILGGNITPGEKANHGMYTVVISE
jgi:hypothetical protein